MRAVLRSTVALAAFWVSAAAAMAAETAAPPSVALAGNDTVLAVVRAVAAEGDRIRFRIGRRLSGEAEVEAETLDLRLDPSTRAHVRPGRGYVLGLTRWVVTRRPGVATGLQESPEGWHLQRITVLGEAVFPNRRSVRRLLADPEREASPDRLVDDLIAIDDPLGQRLFASELAFRRLSGELPERLRQRLQRAMKGPRFDDQAIDLVLSAVPCKAVGAGWADVARHVLETRPAALDPMSPAPALVLTALDRVRCAPEAAGDFELGARWLRSPIQGVVEAAFELLRSRDQERCLRAARGRLEDPALTPAVRRWLAGRVAG